MRWVGKPEETLIHLRLCIKPKIALGQSTLKNVLESTYFTLKWVSFAGNVNLHMKCPKNLTNSGFTRYEVSVSSSKLHL